MSDMQASYPETVVDLGGRCDWCDEPLERGAVVERCPGTGRRVHESDCWFDPPRAAVTARSCLDLVLSQVPALLGRSEGDTSCLRASVASAHRRDIKLEMPRSRCSLRTSTEP